MLFDLGPGSLRNLRISNVDLDGIRDLFISHPHADHISDLMPFLWAVQIDGRQENLNLYGPPGFKMTLQKLMECTNTPTNFFTFPFTVKEVNFGSKINNISTCSTVHSIPTMAFRVDLDNCAFCYSADTTYCPEVVKLASGVDMLIHEATFLEDQKTIAELTRHSTARTAGQVAKESGAKRLVLFHVPPPNECRELEVASQAKAAYGEVPVVGTDLAQFKF